jgi:hypothetical protein
MIRLVTDRGSRCSAFAPRLFLAIVRCQPHQNSQWAMGTPAYSRPTEQIAASYPLSAPPDAAGGTGREASREAEVAELHAKIGQLTVEEERPAP